MQLSETAKKLRDGYKSLVLFTVSNDTRIHTHIFRHEKKTGRFACHKIMYYEYLSPKFAA